MNVGRRSDLITFELRTLTVNEQQHVESWSFAFKQWAEAIRQSETVARFTIPYKADIRPNTHRIVWESSVWNITNEVHDQKRTVTIIDCDFSMMIEATHLDSTEREFVTDLPLVRKKR